MSHKSISASGSRLINDLPEIFTLQCLRLSPPCDILCSWGFHPEPCTAYSARHCEDSMRGTQLPSPYTVAGPEGPSGSLAPPHAELSSGVQVSSVTDRFPFLHTHNTAASLSQKFLRRSSAALSPPTAQVCGAATTSPSTWRLWQQAGPGVGKGWEVCQKN